MDTALKNKVDLAMVKVHGKKTLKVDSPSWPLQWEYALSRHLALSLRLFGERASGFEDAIRVSRYITFARSVGKLRNL